MSAKITIETMPFQKLAGPLCHTCEVLPPKKGNTTCQKCINIKAKNYYHEVVKKDPKLAKAHSDKARNKTRAYRLEALTHYCGGMPPFCGCCGEKEFLFLCLDHIHGGGNKHRKMIAKEGVCANSTVWWLRKHGYPEGFQVLCHNCNMAKGFYGECPHRRKVD